MSENIFEVSPEVTQNLSGIDPLNRLRAEAQIARMRNQAQTETLDMRDRQAQSDVAQRRRDDIIASPTAEEAAAGASALSQLDPTDKDYLEKRRKLFQQNPEILGTAVGRAAVDANRDEWAMTEAERAEKRDIQRKWEQDEQAWVISKQRQAEEFATKLLLEDPDLQDDYADFLALNGGDPIAAAMDTQRVANSRKYNMVLRQMGVPESELAQFGPRDQRMITTDDYLDIIAELQQKEVSMEMERRESLRQQGYTPRDPDFYPPPKATEIDNRDLIQALEKEKALANTSEDRLEEIEQEIEELTIEQVSAARAARSGAGQGGSGDPVADRLRNVPPAAGSALDPNPTAR